MRRPNAIALFVAALAAIDFGYVNASAAVITGGGGSKSTDCLAVFDAAVNSPASNPRNIVCEDGAACDQDTTINGICEVSVVVCANSAAIPECSFSGVDGIIVDHAEDDGDPKFDPEFQALQTRIEADIDPPTAASLCTSPSQFRVAIKGPLANNRCRRNTKRLRLTAESDVIAGRVYSDRDSLKIVCLPSTLSGGCDPQVLFTSTFDRIQKQVFNQSCALSSCHDSQSQTGGLLLETGASHASLINQDPTNPAAFGNGWKRVTPNDPTNSFIFHKINGDLPSGAFGERMPLGRPKLPRVLRDLIEIWIQNGAPDGSGGWIPGTF
jgi:hypothetical protein